LVECAVSTFGDLTKANPALPPIHQRLFENIHKRHIASLRAFLHSDNSKIVNSERAADLPQIARRNTVKRLRAYLKQAIDIANAPSRSKAIDNQAKIYLCK
jgi:hypothetical protein